MKLRRISVLASALLIALLGSACGGLIDPSKNTNETFSASLQPGSAGTHYYNIGKNGEITVTLTSVVPPPANGALAVALGQPQGSICALLSGYIQSAVVNRPVAFGFINKGSYCIQIFDPGVLNVAVTYTGTFSHP